MDVRLRSRVFATPAVVSSRQAFSAASSSHARRQTRARATDEVQRRMARTCLAILKLARMQETGEKIANVMKGGVRFVAGSIEKMTDAVAGIAPESIERPTIKLGVQVVIAIVTFSIVKSFLALAFTLGVLAVASFAAVKAFNIDVDEILDSAKNKLK